MNHTTRIALLTGVGIEPLTLVFQVQVVGGEQRTLLQSAKVPNAQTLAPEFNQTIASQLLKRTVHMNGCQSQRIREQRKKSSQ